MNTAAQQLTGEPLVERDAQLARLSMLIESSRAGAGHLVLVEGPAGIGKTRLLTAARAIAEAVGVRVLRARGSELEQGFAFGVVRQLVEPALLTAGPERRRELFKGAAGLAEPLFAPVGEPVTRQTPDADQATLHGIYWLLATLAQEAPLLLCVDDAHWADGPSLRLLGFLARRLDGLPLLALGARRPAPVGDGRAVADPLSDSEPEVIRPRALSVQGIADVVRLRLGTPCDTDFATACLEATGGNPFYLSALLDELADLDLLPGAQNTERVRNLDSEQVAQALLRRLAALPHGARALAEAVAVLGDGVSPARAAALVGLEPRLASTIAEALAAANILTGDEWLAFVHPIVRASVYAALDFERRRSLHREAAVALAEVGASAEEVATQLMRAGPAAMPGPLPILRKAAERALGRGAPEVATGYLRQALQESVDDNERRELLLELGRAQARAGASQALEHLEEALRLSHEPAQRVESTLALARVLGLWGRPADGVELLAHVSDGLVAQAPEQALPLEVELLVACDLELSVRPLVSGRSKGGSVAWPQSGPLVSVLLAHEAVERLVRGHTAVQAADLAERALADGTLFDHGTPGGQLFLLTSFVLSATERFDRAQMEFERAIDAARERGSASMFVAAAAQRALVVSRRGRPLEAEADARAALEVARLNSWPPLELMALTALIDALTEQGKLAAARAELAQCQIDLRLSQATQAATLLCARGRLHLELGEPAAAADDLLEVGRRLAAWGVPFPAAMPWRSNAALSLAAMGERDQALELATEEVTLARAWGTPRSIGAALRGYGLVIGGDEGDELLSQAVAELAKAGAPMDHASALTDLGAATRRSGRQVDARGPLRRGLELARSCGAEGTARRAGAELRATGDRPPTRVDSGLDTLTPSERRVAEMVAGGLTNREVAEALFVTVRTVENHLAHAYPKLDINSRRELPGALED